LRNFNKWKKKTTKNKRRKRKLRSLPASLVRSQRIKASSGHRRSRCLRIGGSCIQAVPLRSRFLPTSAPTLRTSRLLPIRLRRVLLIVDDLHIVHCCTHKIVIIVDPAGNDRLRLMVGEGAHRVKGLLFAGGDGEGLGGPIEVEERRRRCVVQLRQDRCPGFGRWLLGAHIFLMAFLPCRVGRGRRRGCRDCVATLWLKYSEGACGIRNEPLHSAKVAVIVGCGGVLLLLLGLVVVCCGHFFHDCRQRSGCVLNKEIVRAHLG